MPSRFWVICLAWVVACGQPTLISCPLGELPCGNACIDVTSDNANCGACEHVCGADQTCSAGVCIGMDNACFENNGGCSPDAFCMDIGGAPACLCKPAFTGNGQTCTACTVCGTDEFASTTCSPTTDAVCSACSPGCQKGKYESQPCGGNSDRICTFCSQCPPGMYIETYCSGAQDTICTACSANCVQCAGATQCFECEPGYTLSQGVCNPPMCGNGVLEGSEVCDDGNLNTGDGCSDQCMVESGFYCFGNGPSKCRAGNCVIDQLTALPLTNAFELDGAGTASAAGITFSQRSTIRTAADVAYPILIEADVVYNGNDITFAGARGPGTRDGANGDEATDTLRARLTSSSGLMQLVEATNTIDQGKQAFFTPTQGVPYRIRYVDDGLTASIEWFNVTNPFEGDVLGVQSSFHGTGDRAFIGSDNATVSNLRVCSAEMLPVTSGLVARYSAIPSWTITQDMFMGVTQWQDISGNGHDLTSMGLGPIFGQGYINNSRPGVSFQGGTQMFTAAFPLTTEVTVFAVIHHNTPSQWGAIAHHGSRDMDWSMEQSGSSDPNTLHWQTNNDNANLDVTLLPNTDYVLTGRLGNNMRYFSATAFSGTSPAPASFTDASESITPGDKNLFVGTSDNNEASNAFIGDLVYFNRALSDAERDSVIAYLRRLWQP